MNISIPQKIPLQMIIIGSSSMSSLASMNPGTNCSDMGIINPMKRAPMKFPTSMSRRSIP